MRKIKQTLNSIDRNRAEQKIRNGRDGQAYDALKTMMRLRLHQTPIS